MLSNYEGFTNWGFNPTKSQWQNLVSRAPASSSGTDWHDWLISQTQAEDPESPTSPGFFSTQSCGNPAAWTATDNQGNNFDHSTSEWYVIQLKNDSFQLEVETSNSNYFNWPIRALASGEQYYWYQ